MRATAKIKIMILLLSLFLGSMLSLTRRFDPFRVTEVVVRPFGSMPCTAVWEAIPDEVMSFWPSLVWSSHRVERSIESFWPVEMSLHIDGWGRIRAEIEPLQPSNYVAWNSRTWLLDRSGRLWPATLPANSYVRGMTYPNVPILSWDKSLPLPIDPEAQGADIHRSGLPTDKIDGWFALISKMRWADDVFCVMAKKSDGRQIVQILLGRPGDVTSELIFDDDVDRWGALAAAIDKVFPHGEYASAPGMIINAAFSDKMFSVTKK